MPQFRGCLYAFLIVTAIVLIFVGLAFDVLDRNERLHILERKPNPDGSYDAVSFVHEYSPIDAPYYEVAVVPGGMKLDKQSWVLKLGHEDISPFKPELQLSWISRTDLLITYRQGQIELLRKSLRPHGLPWSEVVNIQVIRRRPDASK